MFEIYRHRPETIYYGKTANSDIFSFDDLNDLKRHVIEKNIIGLGYKRIEELNKMLSSKLGIRLTMSKISQRRLARIVQIRNVISHNRGLVNHVFASRVGAKIDRVGEPVKMPSMVSADRYLMALAKAFDGAAIKDLV